MRTMNGIDSRTGAMLVLGLWAASASGGFDLPQIELISAQREVDVLSSWVDGPPPGGMGDGDFGDIISTAGGFWSREIGVDVGNANATASQASRIGRLSIWGEAETEAFLDSAAYEGDAGAVSAVSASFTLPVDTTIRLRAEFEFEGQRATGWSRGQVLLSGTNEAGIVQVEVDSENPDTWSVDIQGTYTANTQVILVLLVQAQRGRHPDLGDNEIGSTLGRMSFHFVFGEGDPGIGDGDEDGLLDSWEEENQIDLGDGAIIDLTEFDPDPDKIDLFVEVDVAHWDAAVDLKTEVFDKVVASFAQAPVATGAPGGSTGVNLHVLIDEDLESDPSILTLNQPNPPDGPWELPPQYYAIKGDHLGTPEVRMHPLWDQGPLKDAWLSVFRYALWVDRLQMPWDACEPAPLQCSPGLFRQFLGWAEGIPSNDFVVAAGQARCLYDSTPGATDKDLKDALAGTFMHELGHTLGLRHGGGENNLPNFKPNHLSVMNYAYGRPIVRTTAQGSNARIAWLLDYSRQALKTLDENLLIEADGLDGPAQCLQPNLPDGGKCAIVFNSGPESGDQARLTIANADSAEIDWNNDFAISGTPLVPAVDLTRFQYRVPERCGGGEIQPEYDELTSHSDWELLVYRPPTGTIEPAQAELAARRQVGPQPAETAPQIEMDQYTYYALIEADWVDQAFSSRPLIFRDSFESSSPATQ